ncbi:Ferredoxin-dependent glutamate synthase 1 [Usitatibacter rugosus]|uniref:Glutamate synthase [NADPH] large chain n=1 Tax=Usitatibacter rugosus TaxID=2732067 RepID=A0A6M4H3P3_9PROT|nr:glutamate synthase large subunit [Usitatibacter rugosus]QJR13144.1 Ferredoxin-dependent glutamate synthase 1 [Usitatibacter rugosus]
MQRRPEKQGLYDPRHEHDACGVGFVAHIKGKKSHDIVEKGLTILNNLTHRGATGADPLHGDGAGVLIQIPDAFFREEMAKQGVKLPKAGAYGVGMVFLPRSPAARDACVREIERAIANEGQMLLGWRDVPISTASLGPTAMGTMPVIRQVFVGAGRKQLDRDAFERKLYIIRKSLGHAIRALGLSNAGDFYVPSFSHRTIVYKGMLLAHQVGEFYTDLHDKRLTSALCLAHQRFSTNTFPTWDLAHPFRFIAHNGEINTLQGNLNWIRSRQATISSALLGDDLDKIWPLIYDGQSDSASFDNALELLVMGGYPIAHAMMLMIPEAWAGNPLMDARRRAFYEYNAALMEPWDGPAAVAFTDGKFIGATLDRNGLRPARYLITDDDLIVMSSEMGVLDIPQEKIIKKWRLQPGKMLLVDLEHGRIVSDEELKRDLAAQRPYQDWLDRTQMRLEDLPTPDSIPTPDTDKLLDRQQAFGYTQEDLKMLMTPMAVAGEEPIGSMGDDTPLAVLSNRAKPLYAFFRQQFAQVTNPPIDPIREQLVMSLVSFIGPRPNLLSPDSTEPVMRLEVSQPILTFEDMEKLRRADEFTNGHFKSEVLSMCFPADWGVDGVEPALARLCADAEDAVRKGVNIIILTDREMSRDFIAIPALLATAAVHHHLVRAGLRTRSGLVIETGSAREVHHFACLAGFGAEAIHPNLAFATLLDIKDGLPQKLDDKEVVKRYIKAVGKGLLKVMSKMGISTYQSYCGAQIFEAVGLNTKFVDKYFTGTPTAVEGLGLAEVARDVIRLHAVAYANPMPAFEVLDPGGEYAYRTRGEAHMWTPDTIAKLQHATRANNFTTYRQYSALIDEQAERLMTLRGLFRIKEEQQPIPLEEVEPAKEIVKRFATGAMSLGSISHEAHSTLAIAMNRMGGKSNTGEGGEDPIRYVKMPNGDSMRSAIKQVAAGRFGVTAEYLVNADDLQIKMAQGAKPGEGGQLPGHKVSKYIAKVRHTVPGVGLISPPPHHDIYSIEDLAQLIHDLKNVNPKARVSVKLVSEIGVGTIAAGVAKAKADHVTISGFDGGTGASPLSSLKHAGSPWEIGLAETQQTLVLNQLRGRISVQADGQMKTGRDVVVGALLGADEFGFATAPLVVQGCIMMRKCHLNTCPVGVATQDPELIKKFTGKPEHVINYFFFVAEEVREWMAKLGFRTFDEMVGRTDKLDIRAGIEHYKARGLDFTKLFHRPQVGADVAIHVSEKQNHGLEKALDHELMAKAKGALEAKKPVQIESRIFNRNRTVGAMLSGEVARRYGHAGLADDTIHVKFKGTAGQTFAGWLAHGVTFELEGDANDYVGKGLSGGRVVIYPPKESPLIPEENILIGNTVMYGAINGEAYFRGVAGERFCVRNSGATAVVEGVGDHGCEYMTGGTVVVLGKAGRNFAAGMSGGIAYVLDEEGDFAQRCNMAMVELEPIPEEESAAAAEGNTDLETHGKVKIDHVAGHDSDMLKGLIQRHLLFTGSDRARRVLENWALYQPKFVKVMPTEYRRALAEMAQEQAKTKQPAEERVALSIGRGPGGA